MYMSTRFAFAGNAERVTGMFPIAVEGTVTEGAPGTSSVFVFTKYPGDQSLTSPSGYTHWN